MLKFLVPAIFVCFIFYPCDDKSSAEISLQKNGVIQIKGSPSNFSKQDKKDLIKIFRKMGAYSHSSLAVEVENGLGIHYAGTFPMRKAPVGNYETNEYGELNNCRNVYIIDGASFTELPAKNYSFTLMANAMRIADHIVNEN